MKIIVVGVGKVGSTLAERLSSEGHSVTIVDTNAEIIEELTKRYDVMGVVGNATSYNTLIESGIEETDVLIAVTELDELNLLCCLIARKASGCNTIARVRNPVYNQEIGFIKRELGISMIINPELAAAVEIARNLRVPSAIDIDVFANGRVEILSVKIPKNSSLHGLRLMDLKQQVDVDVLVCAVEREEEIVIPGGSFVLEAGDKISIVASAKDTAQFFDRIGLASAQVKNTMIVGGGRIGYYLARQLLQMGVAVKLIEKDRARCEELGEFLPKAEIICGDGVDRALLEEEGVGTCESFVALTGLDEENIILTLYAKQASERSVKTVTKINHIVFDEVINSLDLGSVVVPRKIMTDRILQYVRARQDTVGSNVETLYRVLDGKAEALEFSVSGGSELIDKPLHTLHFRDNLLIGCIYRNGTVIIPHGNDVFKRGDMVVVVTTISGLADLSDILR